MCIGTDYQKNMHFFYKTSCYLLLFTQFAWTKQSKGWRVRFLAETYIFILNFLLISRYLQLGGTHANEIKHDYSPVVFDYLDPKYD